MPNIKSAKKRVRVAEARADQNKAAGSAVKTDLKKFDAAVEEGDREAAVAAYKNAVHAVDKAVHRHILHRNAAAHRKSSMTVKLNRMS